MRLTDIERQRLAEREEWMASTRGKDIPASDYDSLVRRLTAAKAPAPVATGAALETQIRALAVERKTKREIAGILGLSVVRVQQTTRAMRAEGVL